MLKLATNVSLAQYTPVCLPSNGVDFTGTAILFSILIPKSIFFLQTETWFTNLCVYTTSERTVACAWEFQTLFFSHESMAHIGPKLTPQMFFEYCCDFAKVFLNFDLL